MKTIQIKFFDKTSRKCKKKYKNAQLISRKWPLIFLDLKSLEYRL